MTISSETLKRFGIVPNRKLGQNFLLNPLILEQIADFAGDLEGKTVIEVGPGPGGLTEALLQKPLATLWLIERDQQFLPLLRDLGKTDPRLHIMHQDALEAPWEDIGTSPRILIANLPYNISVPLLLQWLKASHLFEKMILMFQKEVADRLMAQPSTSSYGRLSVMTQWCATVRHLWTLPPEAFTPPPEVSSSVVEIIPHTTPQTVPWQGMERVTRTLFGQRRKMLRSSLKQLTSDPHVLLSELKIDPQARPENLSKEQFIEITQFLEDQKPHFCSSE